MASKSDRKVACLGAGYFAAFHYDAWRRIDTARLVGACDNDIARAEATGAPGYSDLRRMLLETKPDILDIITPPPGHMEAIRTALDTGVGTIICQKPFCRSLDEAREATDLAEQAGANLIIHENFRFQPWYRKMKEALEEGRVGTFQQFTFRLRTGDGQGPDAYLSRQPYFQAMPRFLVHETGVHWIDTFRFLLGEPSAVYADLRRVNPAIAGEDAGYLVFDYPEGGRALFDGNRLLDHAAENCRTTLGEALLEGTGGTITLQGDGSLLLRSFGSTEPETLLAAEDWPGFAGDCVCALNKHVIEALDGLRPFENEARDYLKVIEVEEALYESDRLERKIREFTSA